MIATTTHRPATFADLHKRLGKVPLERIRATPAPGTATEADLLVAGKPICELIDGVLVEKAMGTRESLLAGLIFGYLWEHVGQNDLGRLLPGDGMCRLRPGNVRVPDVSFIPWERMPEKEEPEENVWSVTPALAIEVLSKSNTKAEIDQKITDLFATGCKLAWVINPTACDLSKDTPSEGGSRNPREEAHSWRTTVSLERSHAVKPRKRRCTHLRSDSRKLTKPACSMVGKCSQGSHYR
jgi:Uma2 family endonuclease